MTMAWLAVDENEDAYIFEQKPSRTTLRGKGHWDCKENYGLGLIDDYVANILVGRELTWEDEPIEI